MRSGQGEPSNLRAGSTSFNLLVKNYLTEDSKIMLLCCVVENSIAGSQAVEYCHKIRSYFKGDAAEELNLSSITDHANSEAVKAFKQLAGLVSEVEKTKNFIDRMFDAKRNGEGLSRSHAQLKNLIETLRDDVSDLLSMLAESHPNY
jgi:hypothetical protein